jgi:hypothetical protein
VIHFSAGQWSSFRLPAGVFITGAAVFSTSNAWAFGQGPKAGEQYNLRYDGHSWRRVALPVAVDSVSAASATDIWASGAKSAGPHSTATVEVAMHWNGRTWATVPFPKIKPPAGWTEGAHLSLALGPRNVWGQYEFSNMGGCCRAGGLLHWDGSAWHRVSIPTAISVFAGNVAADGHGGLWLQGGNGLSNSFFHYAAGHWRRYSEPVPSEQLLGSIDLAAIPGTHSVWGVSWIGPNSTTDQSTQAAIVKFGP